jgi:large subunit ribosomal protein L24
MKNITIHLSTELIGKYGIKKFPVRKGDVVRVVKGDAEKDEKQNTVGKEGKVIKVLKKDGKVIVENLNIAKSDGKMKPRKMDPSTLIIMKLDTEDKIRKAKLASLAALRNKTIEEEPPAAEPESNIVSTPEENAGEKKVEDNQEEQEEVEKDE